VNIKAPPTNETEFHISTLPSITAIQTKYKHRHGFICTPRLLLCTRRLYALTTPTREQTRLEQFSLNTTHFINLPLVGLFPIQPT
jgi:hypothetical protein